ncbi:MAG: YidC/Oxa1 family membrane protein insertase [Candidatus Pacebacteria bacterium]|nr:YidC/Oxa1 family membrane protein insertase [Candidatus Paceibacterota bacterium]
MFNTYLYEPLYNTLVFLIGVLPGHSVGLAIIVLTIIVKLIILPLTHKSTKSQAKMKKIEPEAQKLREKHKNNKQVQAQQIMDLYKRHGVNPFSSCLLMLVQFPVIIALYWVFYKGLNGGVQEEILYSFIQYPESINMFFLGVFDLAGKSMILALLAGITQFFQMKLAMPDIPKAKPKDSSKEPSFKEDLARNMSLQMRYMMPIIVFVIAWQISAAVALYWVVSNIFSVIHELIVKREADRIINPVSTD